MGGVRSLVVFVMLGLALAPFGCSGDDERDSSGPREPELRAELLDMQQADQAERTGRSDENNDKERADRLQEIIDEHGWPGFDLVGKDGATAAWLIAQHADFDVEFQEAMLDLMRPEVEAGNADPSELAYLIDRIAVHRDEDQTYGTQIGCEDGEAVAGRIEDAETVDERRAEVGLEPLADYMASIDCSTE